MGVFYSSNPLEWTELDGVYFDEIDAPPKMTGIGAGVVGMVGEFPWGPVDEPTLVGDPKTLIETFFGFDADPRYVFGDAVDTVGFPGYEGARSIIDIPWPSRGIYVVRADGASGSEAEYAESAGAIVDSGADVSFVLQALYPGLAGNRIQYKIVNETTTFTVYIKWGNRIETFEEYSTIAEFLVDCNANSKLVSAVVGDAGALIPDAIGYAALTTGADATIATTDYSGSSLVKRGFRLFDDLADVELFFAGGFADTTLNTAVELWLAERGYGIFFPASAVGEAVATAGTNAAAIDDDRAGYCWPRVLKAITATGENRLVGLDAYAAATAAFLSPHKDLGAASAKDVLASLVGIETGVVLSRAVRIVANKAGVMTLEPLKRGGFKFVNGISTDASTLLLERRMGDLIHGEQAERLEDWRNEPIDARFKSGTRSVCVDLLEWLKTAPRNMIAGYEMRPDEALNNDASIGNGEWHIGQKVRLHAPGRFLVVHSQVGTTVEVSATPSQ